MGRYSAAIGLNYWGRKIGRLITSFLGLRFSAEPMAVDSRTPDLDNLQERLKTAQEECQRLIEENVPQERAALLLGIPEEADLSSRDAPIDWWQILSRWNIGRTSRAPEIAR
jgi:hypothetical protein